MCEAKDWRHLRTFLCIFCFLLCVVFDVHVHGKERNNAPASQLYTKTTVSSKYDPSRTESSVDLHKLKERAHQLHRAKQSEELLTRIFGKYGRDNQITFEGLEHLMQNLGIGIHSIEDTIEDHLQNNTLGTFTSKHDHDDVHNRTHHPKKALDSEHDDHDHEEHGHAHEHDHEESSIQRRRRSVFGLSLADYTKNYSCVSALDIYRWYNHSKDDHLTEDEFQDLCPSLIYMIDSRICKEVKHDEHDEHVAAKKNWKFWTGDPVALKMWGASLLAVFITSFGGVLTICFVQPLMKTRYYTLVVQTLIALAVGTLTGDALLHLIPHALFGAHDAGAGHAHGESDQGHLKIVTRCLTALGGIYVFFVVERLMVILQKWRSRRRAHRHRSRTFSLLARQVNVSNVGDRLSNPFHRSCVDLIACPDMTIELCNNHSDDNGQHLKSHMHNKKRANHVVNRGSHVLPSPSEDDELSEVTRLTKDENGHTNGDQANNTMWMVCNHNRKHASTPILPSTTEDEVSDMTNLSAAQEKKGSLLTKATPRSSVSSHHHGHCDGHAHQHGHSHNFSSVRAIAYTVILGDGLHNFCDGLAMGTAFSADIKTGISTAIAVFCHELPHELGDFAVLLQAGMSIRMAVVCNLISSIVCLIGMVIGITIAQGSSDWVFMITAGMFLYIALVDMMPELSTERTSRGILGPFGLFLFQNIGFLAGAGIMLLISIFEEDIVIP